VVSSSCGGGRLKGAGSGTWAVKGQKRKDEAAAPSEEKMQLHRDSWERRCGGGCTAARLNRREITLYSLRFKI
jgi:hypothetical protein